jgi:hypothetical protein
MLVVGGGGRKEKVCGEEKYLVAGAAGVVVEVFGARRGQTA